MQVFKLKDVHVFRRSMGEVIVRCPACGHEQTVVVYREDDTKSTHRCFECSCIIQVHIKE